MRIPLDDTTRINGTSLCWQFERLNSNGEWRPQKYFQTFGDALRAAAQREIRTDPAQTVAEAIDACNRVMRHYSKLFDDVGKA